MTNQFHSVELHNLSVKFKDLREIFKLSQTRFAKMLGVSRSQIAGIEQEKRLPNTETLFRLCDIFNITPAEFGAYVFSTSQIKTNKTERVLAHKLMYSNIEKTLVEAAMAKIREEREAK